MGKKRAGKKKKQPQQESDAGDDDNWLASVKSITGSSPAKRKPQSYRFEIGAQVLANMDGGRGFVKGTVVNHDFTFNGMIFPYRIRIPDSHNYTSTHVYPREDTDEHVRHVSADVTRRGGAETTSLEDFLCGPLDTAAQLGLRMDESEAILFSTLQLDPSLTLTAVELAGLFADTAVTTDTLIFTAPNKILLMSRALEPHKHDTALIMQMLLQHPEARDISWSTSSKFMESVAPAWFRESRAASLETNRLRRVPEFTASDTEAHEAERAEAQSEAVWGDRLRANVEADRAEDGLGADEYPSYPLPEACEVGQGATRSDHMRAYLRASFTKHGERMLVAWDQMSEHERRRYR